MVRRANVFFLREEAFVSQWDSKKLIFINCAEAWGRTMSNSAEVIVEMHASQMWRGKTPCGSNMD